MLPAYEVHTDGIDHINVSPIGHTTLGMLLAPSAYTPFCHPVFGKFFSLAGLWGWLVTGRQHDVFRYNYGEVVYDTLRTMPVVYDPQLHQLIEEAMIYKLEQSRELFDLFRGNAHLSYVRYGEHRPLQYSSTLEQWALDDSVIIPIIARLQERYAIPH